MPYLLLKYLTKMSKAIQKQTKNVERYLYHHGFVKIIVRFELQKQGIEWDEFLMNNGFEDQNTT